VKPAAVGAVSGLGILPAHLLFRYWGDFGLLDPAQQAAVAGAIVAVFAASIAKTGELLHALSEWARERLAARPTQTDGQALCLRMLVRLGG